VSEWEKAPFLAGIEEVMDCKSQWERALFMLLDDPVPGGGLPGRQSPRSPNSPLVKHGYVNFTGPAS